MKLGATAGLALLVPPGLGPVGDRLAVARVVGGPLGAGRALARTAAVAIPGGSLDPGAVSKFVMPLVKPPAMPGASRGNKDMYTIAVRQFTQQILPPSLPQTKVWSYGAVDQPSTFHYPAHTIEAQWYREVQVQWRNELIDAAGNYLPHLLPVDQTLHWANPPGGLTGRDMRPMFTSTPGPYTGPVPIIAHLHGADTNEDSDGYPEAWYLPNANNIPAGYAHTGTFYDYYNSKYGHNWAPGTATFKYPNQQRATTLWYHDHSLGMTRANVYAGPVGFYLIRGGPDDVVRDSRSKKGAPAVLPGPAPTVGANPFGEYGEIPLVIQDRSFNADGSLFYPDSRAFFDGYTGPYIPYTDVPPAWNPEFFGNMMVVNGRTWPYLDVQRKRYRFRLLNGCNSRFLILKFSNKKVKFWQIGADGGFLPAPVELDQLLLGPAERADVIVDFATASDAEIILQNVGPDEPFGGGTPGVDFPAADPAGTGQVMQFRVAPGKVNDPTTPPQYLQLPAVSSLGPATYTRPLSLNEVAQTFANFDGPIAAVLGTHDPLTGTPTEKPWDAPISEIPALDTTEVWELYNLTEDAHPIHIHLVQFQVVGREVIGGGPSVAGSNGPLPGETGFKDTIIAYPGEVTRVKARFTNEGFYVWHCHILEHEDNEMMRPYHVGPIPAGAPGM